MKILVVAPPRVGGRIFSWWLSLEIKYMWIHEPFHFHKESFIKSEDELLKELDSNNILVKVNYGDWNNLFSNENFYKLFDKIICLTRKNTMDGAISLTYAVINKNFTKRYEIDDTWIKNNLNEIEIQKKVLEDWFSKIKDIPNSLQLTYEGIYYEKEDLNKLKSYLGIDEFKDMNLLNNKLRYRNRKLNII